jgi:CheY-like chemotaxis protein
MNHQAQDHCAAPLDQQAPVLLVEDMAMVRAAVTSLLQAAGHSVVTAADGEEALEHLRNGVRPCVIILDLNMPRKDGFEFRMDQMNDPQFARIPTAAYSSAPWLRGKAEAFGLVFFHKPSDHAQLIAFVASHRPDPRS